MRCHGKFHGVAAIVIGAWLSVWIGPVAHAATLDSAIQQRIHAATFEVVQMKPPEGAVEYDRPLPLELLPFQERTDKYRSIGTAFAIGPNRYLTAGHVLQVGMGSQFGPPALRDAAGNVYAIDRVLKYSDREDFVLFSLRAEPKDVRPLKLGSHAAINDTVFAVGNALGEGVVIRDGVYTSDTPEELNGEWKWLRFSAAASPGNSGGPLVDQNGRVIGIVLRKSPSENLNYALPIERVVSAPEGLGKIESRSVMRLPLTDAAEPMEIHEHFALPLPLADFYKTVLSITENQFIQARSQLVAHNSARLFPHGSGSAELLHRTFFSPLPRYVRENKDGVWILSNVNPNVFQLDNNGFVRIAGGVVRLRAPDNVQLSTLYGDSKLLMDLVLKGMDLQRQVGGESVRVTSLGKAQEEGSYSDGYGRIWQIRSWKIPYDDAVLSALCLPTPEGYALVVAPAQSGFKDLTLGQEKFLTDYLYVTMTGTLAQWRDYMTHKEVQPRVFNTLEFDIDPDRHVQYHSKRVDFEVKPDLIKLTKDSVLAVDFSFYRDGDQVVWDVSQLTVDESPQKHNSASFLRIWAPESSLPEGFQSTWSKMEKLDYPFNSSVINNNGSSEIRTVAKASAGNGVGDKVHYVLTVVEEGSQPQEVLGHELNLLQQSFKTKEQ